MYLCPDETEIAARIRRRHQSSWCWARWFLSPRGGIDERNCFDKNGSRLGFSPAADVNSHTFKFNLVSTFPFNFPLRGRPRSGLLIGPLRGPTSISKDAKRPFYRAATRPLLITFSSDFKFLKFGGVWWRSLIDWAILTLFPSNKLLFKASRHFSWNSMKRPIISRVSRTSIKAPDVLRSVFF